MTWRKFFLMGNSRLSVGGTHAQINAMLGLSSVSGTQIVGGFRQSTSDESLNPLFNRLWCSRHRRPSSPFTGWSTNRFFAFFLNAKPRREGKSVIHLLIIYMGIPLDTLLFQGLGSRGLKKRENLSDRKEPRDFSHDIHANIGSIESSEATGQLRLSNDCTFPLLELQSTTLCGSSIATPAPIVSERLLQFATRREDRAAGMQGKPLRRPIMLVLSLCP